MVMVHRSGWGRGLVSFFLGALLTKGGYAISQQERLQILKNHLPPGQSHLTPDILMALTLGNSTDAKRILLNQITAKNQLLQTLTPFDVVTFGNAGFGVNRNATNSPFGSTKGEQKRISLGARKTFTTGTQLQSQLIFSDLMNTYPPSAGPGIPLPTRTQESALEIELKQPLWRNSFGAQDQKLLESAGLSEEAVKKEIEARVETLSIQTTNVYYQVWLDREFYKAAEDRLAAQLRLQEIVDQQDRLGTIEKPDVMEVKINTIDTKEQLKQSKDQFYGNWRRLIVNLKLPHELMDIEPSLIPFLPDSHVGAAKVLCEQNKGEDILKRSTSQTQLAQLRIRASELYLSAKEDGSRPDIFLTASTRFNSLESEWGENLSESLSARYPNYFVGIGFEMPLGKPLQKAEALQALQQKKAAELELRDARGDMEINFVNGCKNLELLLNRRQTAYDQLDAAKTRAKLQEERFRLGRISAFDLNRANLFVTQMQQTITQIEASLRQTAWQLRVTLGDATTHIKDVLQMPLKGD